MSSKFYAFIDWGLLYSLYGIENYSKYAYEITKFFTVNFKGSWDRNLYVFDTKSLDEIKKFRKKIVDENSKRGAPIPLKVIVSVEKDVIWSLISIKHILEFSKRFPFTPLIIESNPNGAYTLKISEDNYLSFNIIAPVIGATEYVMVYLVITDGNSELIIHESFPSGLIDIKTDTPKVIYGCLLPISMINNKLSDLDRLSIHLAFYTFLRNIYHRAVTLNLDVVVNRSAYRKEIKDTKDFHLDTRLDDLEIFYSSTIKVNETNAILEQLKNIEYRINEIKPEELKLSHEVFMPYEK